jgi:ribosomal protein S18 acetylase RimI-like enzyme
MEIFQILNSDIFRIKTIAELTWPDTFKDILSDEQIRYMLDWMYSIEVLASQINNGHQFYVLTENEKDLGFVGIELNYPNQGNAKIHKIYVLPEFQGKGIGDKLIEKVVQYSKLNKINSLTLNVNRFNKAIDFYLKKGFKITKEENIDIGNGFLMEDYVMEKILK